MARSSLPWIISLLCLICYYSNLYNDIHVLGQLLGTYPVTPYGVGGYGAYPPSGYAPPPYAPGPGRYPSAPPQYGAPPYSGGRQGYARPPGQNPGFAYAPPYKVQYGNGYASYVGYYPLSTNYSLTFGPAITIGTLTQTIGAGLINASQASYPQSYGGGYSPYG